jgi:hypothetical protein
MIALGAAALIVELIRPISAILRRGLVGDSSKTIATLPVS